MAESHRVQRSEATRERRRSAGAWGVLALTDHQPCFSRSLANLLRRRSGQPAVGLQSLRGAGNGAAARGNSPLRRCAPRFNLSCRASSPSAVGCSLHCCRPRRLGRGALHRDPFAALWASKGQPLPSERPAGWQASGLPRRLPGWRPGRLQDCCQGCRHGRGQASGQGGRRAGRRRGARRIVWGRGSSCRGGSAAPPVFAAQSGVACAPRALTCRGCLELRSHAPPESLTPRHCVSANLRTAPQGRTRVSDPTYAGIRMNVASHCSH